MRVCESKIKLSKYPNSWLFNYDEEKERLIMNSIGILNFKDLVLESLTPEFLKLFQENSLLFYSQPFLNGVSYEYGLFGKSKNIVKAFEIYKDAADYKYDYLCMYRVSRIYLTDYENFDVKKNEDFHRLYLYKCFAYLPYLIIEGSYYLLNKIDVTKELDILLESENNNYEIFDQFMNFVEINKEQFHVTKNDIRLMQSVLKCHFSSHIFKENIENLDCLLEFEKGDNAYYEAQLKYCNFYLKYSGDEYDKTKIINIFENLVKSEYYKACCDYGRFLIEEKKYEEAKIIFQKGTKNGQQFCFGEYAPLFLSTTNFNQILTDYNLISYLLKIMCITICLDKLGQGSYFYSMYYLTKHSSFEKIILNNFAKYAKELFSLDQRYHEIGNNELITNNFAEKYIIDLETGFGGKYYYGIKGIINSDKEKALIIFKKSYQLAKEKGGYDYNKTYNYLYIYKCRKYLFKNNKITLQKLNKTKEKLFRIYEDCNIDYLESIELYNYYKLYKIGVYGNNQDKLIDLLKKGKNQKTSYSFKAIVYREKCKIALEKEYSNNTSVNQNNILIKNEKYNKDDINIYFKTMENQQYSLRVPKNIQFIIAIHKLYSKYPELETKKIGTYVANGTKVCIYDTIQENGLQDGSIIVIINKVN